MARKSRKQADAEVIETLPAVKTYDVGAYVRLSAVDKKHKGDSIENQQAIIAAYCTEHVDLIIRDVYIDNGISGQTFERPAFQRMLADMESGKISCCISKDLSRLGRSAIDTGYYIEKYFPTHGIRYIAINDNYDSAADNGGMMVSLKNMVNENFALEIGRKIHNTKQLNIKNGCFVGARPPYGYLKSKEDSHKLVPDPYASAVVRRMFEMAARGEGVTAIHKWLNDNDIMPTFRYFAAIGVVSEKMAQGNENWSKTQIYAVLKNRVYVGDMVQGKVRTHSYDQKRLPQSEWVITPDTHEPLVSREDFERVQKLFGKEKAPRNPANENIFLRKIFCGHCGYTMTRSVSGKTSHLFGCSARQNFGQDSCVQVSINEDKLKQILLTLLQKQAAALVDSLDIVADNTADQSELRNIGAQLNRVSGFLKGLYESLFVGDIDDREYREMKQSYETKIAALTEREHQLREALRERHLKQAAVSKANARLGTVNFIADLTAPALDALVEKILVFHDKHIEVRFKFTDEIVKIETERSADNDIQ